ncbi:hypothetical protein B0H21DRAFT_768098 [Amylocystis lapponica]|nr:hypothetical protein B0H21DRAFT_768098 [Amylocystis lapponica]
MDVVPSAASIQDILQAALKLSLTGGDFIDTKFYVFSHRTASGTVSVPRSVFANSLSLRKISAHFERLLSGGFAESVPSRLDASSYADEHIPLDVYGYESDSDLEDEDEEHNIDDGWEIKSSSHPHTADEPGPRPECEGLVPTRLTTDGPVDQGVEANNNLPESADTMIKTAPPISKDLSPTVRTVFVKDMAFKTWQAFIFYAYFGKVEFAPLRSQDGTIRKEKGSWQTGLYQAPLCSPKSMYRLADKYDLKALRELSKKDIKAKLTEDNILVELFSHFTSRYPEILELEIQFIRDDNNVKTKTLASLPRWVESVAAGHMPHSGEVLMLLFQNLISVKEPVCSCGYSGSTRRCNNCNRSL